MKQARMLLLTLLTVPLAGSLAAHAGSGLHHDNSDVYPLHNKILTEEAKPARAEDQPVVAMDAEHAKSIRAGELVSSGAKTMVLLGRNKLRAELSPRTVAEISSDGSFRLLRGSALVERQEESVASTPGAKVEYVGRALLSYDHKEQSSSVFVLSGEARVVNPHRDDSTLRLSRFHGATFMVGEVLPKLVRQLDIGGVSSWMAGYSWPEKRRKSILSQMPGEKLTAAPETAEHLESARIEDYFSSIDTADEFSQPDYYDRKFDDPDKVVAEANSKQGNAKVLSPEEAALISLPKTTIDLGFDLGPEVLTADQKAKEVAMVEPKRASRAPASAKSKPKAVKKAQVRKGDPDVNLVLDRLRQVREGKPVISRYPESSRQPASSAPSLVPDPVYDYSQNF